jgi:hypothetical protein
MGIYGERRVKFDQIEEAWLKHAYDGFPRKVGTPTQRLIQNREDFLQYVWSMLGRTNIYTSLFSEISKEIGNYYRIYIDIDCINDLSQARKDAITVAGWFISHTNTRPTVYFSGQKGFAVYFYFKPMKMDDYQYTARAIIEQIKTDTGVNTIDMITIGDIARISRLPFTKHIGSGMWCIPIDMAWPLREIIGNAVKWNGNVDFDIHMATGIKDWIREWEEKGKEHREEIKSQLGNGKNYGWDLDLIMKLAPYLIGGRRSLMYRVIIPKMYSEGASYNEIVDYINKFIYSSGSVIPNIERIIQRHLRYTQQGKSLLWSQEKFFMHEPWAIGVFTNGERKIKNDT